MFGYDNYKKHWFDVDMARFAAYSARTGGRTQSFHAGFGLTRPEDHFNDAVTVDADLIREQAPKTYAIPDLRNVFEMTVAAKMVSAFVPFGDTSAGQSLAIINARWTWGMTTLSSRPSLQRGFAMFTGVPDALLCETPSREPSRS
jgi:hypothetical protein